FVPDKRRQSGRDDLCRGRLYAPAGFWLQSGGGRSELGACLVGIAGLLSGATRRLCPRRRLQSLGLQARHRTAWRDSRLGRRARHDHGRRGSMIKIGEIEPRARAIASCFRWTAAAAMFVVLCGAFGSAAEGASPSVIVDTGALAGISDGAITYSRAF